MIGEYVIVRSRDQGVVCGVLKVLTPQPGGLACAELTEASQIHNWQGDTNTLFEAALRGFGVARISEPVARVMVFGVCGVLPCTPEAEANLRQPRWNEAPTKTARRSKAHV
jgi:hypothetical protein